MLSGDYYSSLGVSRGASLEDIRGAFRKVALKYHPEKNAERRTEATKLFADVCEAYEVLSQSKLRGIYDQYGEDGLKHGGTGNFGIPGGYKFSGDPEAVFQKFFGIDNPFEMIGDFSAMQETQHQFFSNEGARNKDPPQCYPIHRRLECTLEEFYHGVEKIVEIEIANNDEAGKEVKKCTRSIKVIVEKGVPKGHKIKYPKQGTEREGWINGDVYIILDEKAHPRFTREEEHLIYQCDISLEQALTGFPIDVKTLDEQEVNIFICDVVHPKYVKAMTGAGMPVYQQQNKFGDILIHFNITFPRYLAAEQQAEIKKILKGTE